MRHLPREKPYRDGRPVTQCGIVGVAPPGPNDRPCLICEGRAGGLTQAQAIGMSQRTAGES